MVKKMSVCMYVDICTLVPDKVVTIGLWGQARSRGAGGGVLGSHSPLRNSGF